MIPEEKLEKFANRFAFLEAKMSTKLSGMELIKLSREYSELRAVIEKVDNYRKLLRSIEAVRELAGEPELRELAVAELAQLERTMPSVQSELRLALLPKDMNDSKPAILEIRAGTGGEEAALFVADLYRMYQRYADLKGWKFELIAASPTGLGGCPRDRSRSRS